jgi:phosphoglycolate phosphatase-like HAD superfamily hydrolase
MYEALLFDMDGVLLEGRGTDPTVYREATRDVYADAGVDGAGEFTLDHHDGGLREIVADAERVGLDPETVWADRERRASEIEHERIRAGERAPFDDVDALHGLADDYALAVVSNNRQATVELVAKWAGIDDAVSVLRGRRPSIEDYRRRKPDSYFLRDALERLGVDPGRALYVGDRETDLVAANEVGAGGAVLRRSHHRDATLDREPAYEIESLTALADRLDDGCR